MQVKKFEAPTLQEALETIKRELGPEAIILQTKSHKRGFGLMSKGSVEVTAAVSDRSKKKKEVAEKRMPEPSREAVKRMPAEKQAQVYDDAMDSHLRKAMAGARDRVDVGAGATAAGAPQMKKAITARRYIDIDDAPAKGGGQAAGAIAASQAESRAAASKPRQYATPLAGSGAPAGAVAAPMTPGTMRAGMPIEDEVRHLKRMIEELKNAQDETLSSSGAQALMSAGPLSTPALQDAFDQLVLNGVEKRHALTLMKRVAFEIGEENVNDPEAVLDGLASELMTTVQTRSPLASLVPGSRPEGAQGPAVLALVGPTGVGKTTTLAKIASRALLTQGLKVGLINLDQYRVGAFDQLGTYAKILNVPFRSAASSEDLAAALADFQSLDLVLVDTTGRSQKDPASLNEMAELLGAIPGSRSLLVMAATTRDAELYDIAARFQVFRPEGLVFSKLDEANLFGAVLNVSARAKLPISYFTTGQRVPEDLEEASRERIAALVMDL